MFISISILTWYHFVQRRNWKNRNVHFDRHGSQSNGQRLVGVIQFLFCCNLFILGAKEIDIAATLEHLRDQRMGMVKTKAQFEFALKAVAFEVQAILRQLQGSAANQTGGDLISLKETSIAIH